MGLPELALVWGVVIMGTNYEVNKRLGDRYLHFGAAALAGV